MVFVPPFAPFVVLAFLALGGALAVAALALIGAAVFRKTRLIPWILGFGLVVIVGYAGVLLADSTVSRERILIPGEKKYFCEIDCHLAYSVEEVEIAPTVGPPLDPLRARGRRPAVPPRTCFAPRTRSPHRGAAPPSPNPCVVYVRD